PEDDASVGYRPHIVYGQAALLSHDGDKALVDLRCQVLPVRTLLLGHLPREVAEVLALAGRDRLDLHAEIVQQLLGVEELADHADAACQRVRRYVDEIRASRDVVPARCAVLTHRHDYRLIKVY